MPVLGKRPPHPHPAFNLQRWQVIGPTGLGHTGLTLDDLQQQCSLALHGSALDLFFHQCIHGVFLSTITPEQVFTGSIQVEARQQSADENTISAH